MSFNLSQIVNPQVPTQEQTAYGWVFIPPRPYNPVVVGWSYSSHSKYADGFIHLNSISNGSQIKFYFKGRRIGVLFSRVSGNGKLAFDVDGTYYGTVDTSTPADTVYGGQDSYTVASNLMDGNHVLTVTKVDTNLTAVHGFYVDDASAAQYFTRSAPDYQQALYPLLPVSIGTTSTAVRASVDFWMLNAVITNTTASPINVTLQNGAGTAIAGPFPVPANDIKTIPGPLYFGSGMSAIASATGCTIAVGGQ